VEWRCVSCGHVKKGVVCIHKNVYLKLKKAVENHMLEGGCEECVGDKKIMNLNILVGTSLIVIVG